MAAHTAPDYNERAAQVHVKGHSLTRNDGEEGQGFGRGCQAAGARPASRGTESPFRARKARE